MTEETTRRWTRFALLNLSIVAGLGLLMRYKIGFDFPHFMQKYLQHAHSHFAFSGWVSLILMVCMIPFLNISEGRNKLYQWLLGLQALCAYGMLVAFAMQGYGAISIFFSTSSVLLSFVFAYAYIRDTTTMEKNHPAVPWFKAALLFSVLSAAGTFYLAYVMASHQTDQHAYLASVYYYLHFQYNGWFFFACMGLLAGYLHQRAAGLFSFEKAFKWMFYSCFPAYLLSILWLNLPAWLFVLVVGAAAGQVIGLVYFWRQISKQWQQIRMIFNGPEAILLAFAGISLTVKMGLQAASTIPEISELAFGFRTIVIAYLHLVLLGIITVFLLAYLWAKGYLRHNQLALWGLMTFVVGVYLNEMVLGIQGIASFSYALIPYSNHMLVAVSALMFVSLLVLLSAQFRKS